MYMLLFECRFFCEDFFCIIHFWFVGSLIVLHCEGHKSFVRSAIEVHEHLMERLFDKLSNRSSSTSISCQQSFQIIVTSCHCFCRELRYHCRLVIHTWDPDPSWIMPQEDGEHPRDAQGRPTFGGNQGRPTQVGGLIHVKFESISGSRSSL
jgi:hypothetical protein